ncbi:MAG: T9SS type A sorting domain-containing protein [Bacteroidales bacterium]|nr:T9SS type A sorting domain-containing protein [Bacteroidales bacterium]
MKKVLLLGMVFLSVVQLSAQNPTGTIAMNYLEEECYVYLTSVASWEFQADTSGLTYVSIAVCENPDDQPFYLLSECEGRADTLELTKGLNNLTLDHTLRVRKKVPYTAGVWQRYKLDNGQNIFVFDNGLGIAGSKPAYSGTIPGYVFDTLHYLVYDTVELYFTIIDTVRYYDTIHISDTIYVAKDIGSGVDNLPPEALKMIVRADEITANFIFEDAEVYDLTGLLMIKVVNTNTIPIPGLLPGIYILKARINNRIFQTKFLKE